MQGDLRWEKLRFDFTHPSPLSKDKLRKVSSLLNEKIRENLPVLNEEVSLSKAQQRGAVALFEEKYKDKVRVVDIGGFSKEVCGGRWDFAQGGTPHIEKVEEALSKVPEIVKEILK